MNQSAALPAFEKKTNPEVAEEKKTFPKIIPPQVILEITGASKKTISNFANRGVTTWHALTPRRKRFIALFSFSVFISVTMSLIATVIARRVTRKPATKAAI